MTEVWLLYVDNSESYEAREYVRGYANETDALGDLVAMREFIAGAPAVNYDVQDWQEQEERQKRYLRRSQIHPECYADNSYDICSLAFSATALCDSGRPKGKKR